jgi:membrane-bound lytic murein transglycosylase B
MVCVFTVALHAEGTSAMGAVGSDPYTAPIAEATQRFGIPADWIRQIIRAESGGDPLAISPKGAMGLMQLMPKTWAELRNRYGLGTDPCNPHDNILAGAAYLREMHDRYGSPGFLAAYHAGPGRYEDYRDRHRPLPPETRSYVAELRSLFGSDQQGEPAMTVPLTARAWTRAPLFAVHLAGTESADRHASKQTPSGAPATATMRDFEAIAPRSDGLFIALSTSEHKP